MKCACRLPGCNILEFDLDALLPMHGNGASLRGDTVQCGSVALTVASDDKYLLTDFLFERIKVGVAYFCHEWNENVNLEKVRYA
jgi:hypothetical protein